MSRKANGRDNGKSKSRMLKVILLGDGGVGKSCLMNRFISNKYDSQSFHTIGVEFLNKDIMVDGQSFTMQIWDTAGQERFKSLRTPFYRGADCCLLTYAVDDLQSFHNLAMWKKEFLYYADVQNVEQFPFVVLGNKVDLVDRREVIKDDAELWCANNKIPYHYETSAKDAINVDAAFYAAVKRVVEFENYLDNVRHTANDTIDLSKKAQKSGGCC